MTPNIIINEELKTLLPPLSDEERAGLEESILKDGCLSDLVLWNDILVDGHHRYEICTKHDVPFGVKHLEFESLDDAKLWAGQHQENRRNLTTYHKGELALKLKNPIAAKAKERQRAAGGDKSQAALSPNLAEAPEPKDTRQELAQIAGVSNGNLSKIEYISEHADEETKENLRKGKKGTSIHKEYTRLKSEETGVKPVNDDTAVTELEDDTVPNSCDEDEPVPPCPNKDQKYYPKTTLKFITHETPRPLLVNLFEIFPKEYVEELFPMGMEMLLENRGKEIVKKIMAELNEKFGPKKLR